jgi:hypothetical protein
VHSQLTGATAAGAPSAMEPEADAPCCGSLSSWTSVAVGFCLPAVQQRNLQQESQGLHADVYRFVYHVNWFGWRGPEA